MSEEKKDQVQQEPQTQGEPQQELILGKFKDVEALKKSYQALEQKLGDRQSSNDESPKPSADAAGEKEKYEWKAKSAELDAKEALLTERKKEAAAVLSDGDTLNAVRRTLGSSDAIAEFERDFDAGHVSAAEVKRLARQSGVVKESTQTLPESGADTGPAVSSEEEEFLKRTVSNPYSPLFQANHPEHAKIKQRVTEIKAKLYA